jgi:uncharacterized protein (DUF362 family)
MDEKNEQNLGRRQFLARTAKAAASIAAAGAASYLLYDRKGPTPKTDSENLVTLPDFSIPKKPGQVISIVRGSDRIKTVNEAIALLGGIERFVKPGETVVIKPNIAFASSPMLGATTNPELIAEVVRLCYNRGQAKKVYVTDNPINDPASCFMLTGITKAVIAAGGEVILPKDSFFKNTTLKDGKLIKNWPILFEPFKKADKLIGIAPVKDHHRSIASMTMKNWYGLLGGRRNIFHQDIHNIIAELAMLVKPTLVILDGTVTMVTNGPTGGSVADLKKTDTLIASCDMVAADSFGCSLLGLKPENLPYLAMAEKAGVGTIDYQLLKPKLATIG